MVPSTVLSEPNLNPVKLRIMKLEVPQNFHKGVSFRGSFLNIKYN